MILISIYQLTSRLHFSMQFPTIYLQDSNILWLKRPMQLLNKGFAAFEYKIYYALCHVLPPSFLKVVLKKYAMQLLASKSFECFALVVQLCMTSRISFGILPVKTEYYLLQDSEPQKHTFTVIQLLLKKKTKQGTTGGLTELLEFMGVLLLLCVTPRTD